MGLYIEQQAWKALAFSEKIGDLEEKMATDFAHFNRCLLHLR